MNVISASSLHKRYGHTTAVDGIDLEIESGQIFGFLGPNGAGKSTTIKMLTTLIRPSSGSLEVLGIDAMRDPLAIRKKVGVVLQKPSYEPNLTVEKSIEKYGMMWDVPRDIRRQRLDELLSEFDLNDIRKQKNEDLSIGQRRRVQVAREFMHDMELLFLDEPTVGLDPYARRRLLDFLKEKAKAGLMIFYTTHVLTEAEYLCDRISIIKAGRIITTDSPDNLKRKFGSQKTIKIRLAQRQPQVSDLLDMSGCSVHHDQGTEIVIQSDDAQAVLAGVLDILNRNDMAIEEISAEPVTLEDIFLSMVRN